MPSTNDWPLAERPRERLLAQGPGVLSDAELLAIVFGSGNANGSALDCARGVLGRHGNLSRLFGTPVSTLARREIRVSVSCSRLRPTVTCGSLRRVERRGTRVRRS